MARVSLVVHGRGRGHASRALACARALAGAGHELRVFAGGDSEHVLRDINGYATIPIVRTFSRQLTPALKKYGAYWKT